MQRCCVVIAVLTVCLTGCGEDEQFAPPPANVVQQLAATGVGQYLGITPGAMTHNGNWEEYTYDPGDQKAICLGGTHYQVNVRRGSSNNVLLYLEGGGACWSYETCWQNMMAKREAGGAAGFGILDFANPNDPFADWNVVYASYCDGSVFSGDNVVDYNGRRTYHHGVQNLSAAVSLMAQNFPHPDLVVVSGSSAGGYGTFTGYGVTRIAYPDAPLLVLNDSGPGLQNPADAQNVADRLANWQYARFLPRDCSQCTVQTAYLASWALDRDPTLHVALFEYLQDSVIRAFLNLDPLGYEELLLNVSGDLHARHPDRFKRFLKVGILHTMLELPSFYALAIDGTTMRDWTADFLTGGPAWQDIVEQ